MWFEQRNGPLLILVMVCSAAVPLPLIDWAGLIIVPVSRGVREEDLCVERASEQKNCIAICRLFASESHQRRRHVGFDKSAGHG